jgi:hypothetical protein
MDALEREISLVSGVNQKRPHSSPAHSLITTKLAKLTHREGQQRKMLENRREEEYKNIKNKAKTIPPRLLDPTGVGTMIL